MLFAVQIKDHGNASYLVDEMFQVRRQVFAEECGWDVEVNDRGEEIDGFDEIPGIYLISTDDKFTYQGSVRVLPTTNTYMTETVFAKVLGESEPVRDPQVWETTRIHVRPEFRGKRRTLAMAELLLGLGLLGEKAGFNRIITTIETRLGEYLRRVMNLDFQPVGPPVMVIPPFFEGVVE